MEPRKLIKFGNGSYIISLPRSWISKNKLSKGDVIYLAENSNNELIITPDFEEKRVKKEKTIKIEKPKDLDEVCREIISAYLEDYKIIKIVGNIKPYRSAIENLLNNLVALEIIEQTPNKIVAKDFLKIKDVSFPEIIRRIDLILRVMIKTSKECLQKDNFEELSKMDTNVNKMRFLLQRVIKSALKEPSVVREVGCNNSELLDYWKLVVNFENIADECRRIARFFKKGKFKEQDKKEIMFLLNEIEKNYFDVMKAYYTKNKTLAHKVASYKNKIIKDCDKFVEKSNNKYASALAEKLKGMESFVRNIARIVIDKA